ncbi:MAG: type I 3-dehydroquinate dehydratase [Lachnoclostridium sp.]|nr:type I 3-dehydroquinate dehydratase [Lachnoclostridium sp.]
MGNVVHVRNLTIGEGLPKICIPLTDTDLHSLLRSAQTLQNSPYDLVEWRADFYGGLQSETGCLETLQELRQVLGEIPLLFTIRTVEEGGQADISTKDYEAVNLAVIQSGLADLIDVELSKGEDVMRRLCAAAHHSSTAKIVASKHDFAKTPPESEIVTSLCRMQELGADLAKYAVMPTCERDVLTLLSASIIMKEQHCDTPVITMSMGSLGAVSRVCGALSGSAVTFGTAGQASAPGQLPADILKSFLEYLK